MFSIFESVILIILTRN